MKYIPIQIHRFGASNSATLWYSPHRHLALQAFGRVCAANAASSGRGRWVDHRQLPRRGEGMNAAESAPKPALMVS